MHPTLPNLLSKPGCRSAAILAGGLSVALVAAPASAQITTPFDFLFGRSSPPAETAPRPAAPPPAAQPPAAQPDAPASRGAVRGVLPPRAMLPPRRPATSRQSEASPATAEIETVAAATPVAAAAAAPAGPLGDAEVIARANAYFNGIGSLVGDFVQVGGDGRRLSGRLYLQRPGRLRFEYAAPATLEVIADGSSVAVRDRRLATQDLYSISQTPLKFLLRERIDLARDLRLIDVSSGPEGVAIVLEDRSTLGGTSRITLYFDRAVETLRRWRIIDPQGFQTSVTLTNLDRNRRVDQRLFVINYERMLEDRK